MCLRLRLRCEQAFNLIGSLNFLYSVIMNTTKCINAQGGPGFSERGFVKSPPIYLIVIVV